MLELNSKVLFSESLSNLIIELNLPLIGFLFISKKFETVKLDS